jgi:predicted DNA-binding transcriptional regulator YafY
MFLTDFLFSSPRLRFSESQKKAILSWAKDLKAPVVPSLSALKRSQNKIEELLEPATEKVTSASGNVFYMNDVAKAIAMVKPYRLFCLHTLIAS